MKRARKGPFLPDVLYLFPEGVFYMGSIPSVRRYQAMMRRQLGKDLPIVVFRWGPMPLPLSYSVPVLPDPPRDEIDGEPVLMRALPRAHFRGAFGEQVSLPVGTAETLERFEQELRLVGLISKGEVLRQGAKDPTYFRVQVGNRKLSTVDLHSHSSCVERGTGSENPVERSNTLGGSETGFSSKLVTSLESDAPRPTVHDKRPKGRRKAPT